MWLMGCQLDSPGLDSPLTENQVRLPVGSRPDFRILESCRTMPLVGGFFSVISRFPLLLRSCAAPCRTRITHAVLIVPKHASASIRSPNFPLGAMVAERLACSPPTMANRIQSPAGSPDFRMWESCLTMLLVGGFSRGSLVPSPLHSGTAPYSLQSPSSALKTSLVSGWRLLSGYPQSFGVAKASTFRHSLRVASPAKKVPALRLGERQDELTVSSLFTFRNASCGSVGNIHDVPFIELYSGQPLRTKYLKLGVSQVSRSGTRQLNPSTSLHVRHADNISAFSDLCVVTSATSRIIIVSSCCWLRNKCAWSSAEMKRRRKLEIPEKTQPAATFGTIPTCKNPEVTQPGIEPGSPWWEASGLTAQPLWPLSSTEN
ncbi:hypothetical protein PR048_032583 [Dryococelus australis]|uniref:Uncharacterized protein n=1 Tax=Dryococelus australis TaxID=614101 RepID=A0ABQ9G2L6_9NEOP|nr:hypothetical protein PR048_032583 [Dryococelus australis]